jgi:UMF1 family MFS transporter
MGWGLIEMLLYGIFLSLVAVAGGFVGPWLDERFGSRNAVAIEIGVTLACLIAMVSMAPDAILFVIAVDPAARVWDGPVFQTLPQIAYLGASMIIGVSITAAYASSRTLMAKLAPKGMEGELFGLYALAGSATVWLGPLIVETFTATYQSQRAGFGAIAILLLAGLLLLMRVKPPAEQSE